MGDVAASRTAVDELAAQVNRFGPTAPEPHRIAPIRFATSGQTAVTMELAVPAIVIAHRRANEAYVRFGDQGSLQAIGTITAGYANPVGYVTSHLGELTSTLRAYGDSLGLPAAVAESEVLGIPTTYVLIGVALVLMLLFNKGGR
jgi:hypothetical protein